MSPQSDRQKRTYSNLIPRRRVDGQYAATVVPCSNVERLLNCVSDLFSPLVVQPPLVK